MLDGGWVTAPSLHFPTGQPPPGPAAPTHGWLIIIITIVSVIVVVINIAIIIVITVIIVIITFWLHFGYILAAF